jgi:hypothetical protein
LVGSNAIRTSALCIAALPTLLISWTFYGSEGVYEAHRAIKLAAGHDLPRIVANRADPLYSRDISSIVASFTERAWWLHGDAFPDLPNEPWRGEKVFVVSSTIESLAAARDLLATHVDELTPISFVRIPQPHGDLWISGFEVVNRVSLPRALARWQPQRAAIPAAALPSIVGRLKGNTRIAVAGETPQGVLTFGPYARVAAGSYDIVIRYSASAGTHVWDVMLRDEDGARVIRTGVIEPTVSVEAQIVAPITLTKPAEEFQVRTIYSGLGDLTVRAVGIRPAPAR